jgi:hypothetical protein
MDMLLATSAIAQGLLRRIQDYISFEAHDTYLSRLRQGKKTALWPLVS